MREAIYDALVAGVPEFSTDKNGNPRAVPSVKEPHAEDIAETVTEHDLPMAVVFEGVEQLAGTWGSYVEFVDVVVYAREASYQAVDALLRKVVAALNQVRVVGDDGTVHVTQYAGTVSTDGVMNNWQALTRGARVYVYPLSWTTPSGYDPDVVKALQDYTTALFPSAATDPDTWSPDDAAPGIYWRQEAEHAVEVTSWGAWFSASVRGHVLAPKRATRQNWMRLITQRFAVDFRVPFDGAYALVESSGFRSEADPFREGQIALQLRYARLARPMGLAGQAISEDDAAALRAAGGGTGVYDDAFAVGGAALPGDPQVLHRAVVDDTAENEILEVNK